MIRKLICLFVLIATTAFVAPPSFAAGTLANLLFVMPTGVDPINLEFSADGQTLFFTGADTMPDLDPVLFGVEFRSINPLLQFNRFIIAKDGPILFTGDLAVTTAVDISKGSFLPWGVSQSGAVTTLFATPGSTLVGVPDPGDPLPYHSILQFQSLTNASPGDLDLFRSQRYSVTAFAVPEPGVTAFALGMALTTVTVICGRKRKS